MSTGFTFRPFNPSDYNVDHDLALEQYEAERAHALAKYDYDLANAALSQTQDAQRQQQVLFDNQRDLSRINAGADLHPDSGTGLASRLLGGTAQEEGGRASRADSPSSVVGLNTSDENRKRRGISAAVGITL